MRHDEVTWRDNINVRWTDGPATIRYTSGLTIYDEALIDGRWKGRYWAANGWSEVEALAAATASRDDMPAHAFALTVDGQALHFGWRVADVSEAEVPRAGQRHVVVALAHQLRPITVHVHTLLDGSPVLTRWLEITNTGAQVAALGEVVPWRGVLIHLRGDLYGPTPSPLPAPVGHAFSVGRFLDPTWGNEGDFAWQEVPLQGALRLECRRGRSGRPAPFFVIRNEATGVHAIGHLAWSGNWSMDFTYEQNEPAGEAWLAWQAAPMAPAPLRLIEPGETVSTPAAHVGYLFGDLDETVQAMHAHIRASVALPSPEGLADRVVYNHWGYTEHELSDASLRHEIDVARAVGAELFIVDAGWFGNAGASWYTTVGDWVAGDRLAHGLEPHFAYAREHGLLYGLWMDAERIGPDSRAGREHPDWLLRRDGHPVGTALDLTNAAAAAWLEQEINRLVDHYDLDLFRLDYNVDVWEGGYREHAGYYENSLWRHYG